MKNRKKTNYVSVMTNDHCLFIFTGKHLQNVSAFCAMYMYPNSERLNVSYLKLLKQKYGI